MNFCDSCYACPRVRRAVCFNKALPTCIAVVINEYVIALSIVRISVLGGTSSFSLIRSVSIALFSCCMVTK